LVTKVRPVALVFFLLLTTFAAQTQDKAPKKQGQYISRESCDAEKGQAYSSGWIKSVEYSDALDSLSVGDNSGSGKFGLQFIVEDITGSDSYQYAVAEVIRTHFSQNIVVDPQSRLVFWIHGTKTIEITSRYDVQTVAMDIYVYSSQKLVRGNSKGILPGRFTMASDEETLAGYSSEQKTQAVREMAYKVLSNFLSKWQEAAK
jgi:hypothetical protein